LPARRKDNNSQSQSQEIGTFWLESFDCGEATGCQHGQTEDPAPACPAKASATAEALEKAGEQTNSRLEFLEAF
jgi:hypothetical protein